MDEKCEETLPWDWSMSDLSWSICSGDLVKEEQLDPSDKGLLNMVCDSDEVCSLFHCYFLQKEVLLRKRVHQGECCLGDLINQVVVPQKFRKTVLQIAHDTSGHLGVRKTYDCVLRHFFWPRLKKDISDYIRSYNTC